jgi:hypothetical protein
MDGSAFRGIGDAIFYLFIVACVAIPLAVWKLVDIAIWLFHHIHWS